MRRLCLLGGAVLALVLQAGCAGTTRFEGPQRLRPVVARASHYPYSRLQSPIVVDTAAVTAWQIGDVLSTSTGTWLNDPAHYSYEWQECDGKGANCVKAAGSPRNHQTYTLVVGDDARTLRVQVTACNAHGCTQALSGVTPRVTGVLCADGFENTAVRGSKPETADSGCF